MIRRLALPFIGALLVFLLSFFTVNSFASSDPYLSLLVSQAILEQGTIKLDAYKDTAQPPLDIYGRGGMIERRGEHYYHYLPLGPSLFSLPFVKAAQILGKDMRLGADITAVQRRISPLLVALIFFVIYHIAESYLAPRAAFVLTMISVPGTTLMSTVGTALWNVGFVALFTSLALMLIVRYENGKSSDLHPYWLGIFLFCAYLCRPTAAIFIALVLFYLLLRHRAYFLKTAAAALGCLLFFVAFSWLEYGEWLPVYYSGAARRIAVHGQRVPLLEAIGGLLSSPSRGLFIFSPFFAWVFLAAGFRFRTLARQPLVWLCLLWFAGHLYITATATRWWGGHSYGPRLLTDVLPALILFTILVWQEARARFTPRGKQLLVAGYLLLGVAGIVIHSVQGLYNQATQQWNGGAFAPNIDAYPHYLWDWGTPQFLATNSALCRREREFYAAQVAQNDEFFFMEDYHIGERIAHTHGANNVLFVGWAYPQAVFRWTQCSTARILFRLGEERNLANPLLLTLSSGSFHRQDVEVLLNGESLGTLTYDSPPHLPQRGTLEVPGDLLRANAVNELEFRMPDARSPVLERWSLRDQRTLGIAIESLILE